jgi:hypothetical protein
MAYLSEEEQWQRVQSEREPLGDGVGQHAAYPDEW